MLFNDKRWLKLYENLKVSGFADKCCDKMSVTRGRVSEKRDAENIPTRKPQCFQAMGVRLGGLAPLTPPFKQGVRSSNLRRVTMIAEHYRWNGEKASHLNGFGNFLFSKFLGNSIDEIAACRGSNRIWTSVFPYSSGFSVAAPFFRGLRRRDSGKNEEKSFTKLRALDCWFSRTNDQRLFCAQKGLIQIGG